MKRLLLFIACIIPVLYAYAGEYNYLNNAFTSRPDNIGYVDANRNGNLVATLAAVPTTTEIVITDAQTLPGGTTVAHPIRIKPGGSIGCSSGIVLFTAPFHGTDGIFSGAGSFRFAIGSTDHVRPEWWISNTAPGTTNMSGAFTSAFTAIGSNAFTTTTTGAGTYYSAIKFVTRATQYAINSTVTTPISLQWEGNGAQIVIGTGVKAFTTVQGFQRLDIDQVTFFNGATAIEYDTETSDARQIHISNCTFQQQSAYGIKTVQTSTLNGCNLHVKRCRFFNYNIAGAVAIQAYADLGLIEDCWFTTGGTYTIENYGNLTISGATNSPWSGTTFVKNYGTYLRISDSRLGAENGAAIPVEHHTSGVWTAQTTDVTIDISDNILYTASNPVIKLYALPNKIYIVNNSGSGTGGIEFDTTIPDEDVANFSAMNYVNNGNTEYKNNLVGESAQYKSVVRANVSENSFIYSEFKESDYITHVPANSFTGEVAGTTFSYYTSAFQKRPGWKFTNLSTAQKAPYFNAASALSSLVSGQLFTAVCGVEVIEGPYLWLQFYMSGKTADIVTLARGNHIVSVPSVYVSGENDIGIYTGGLTGSMGFTGCRLFNGVMKADTHYTTIYHTAAPVTKLWQYGDRVINSVPTVGQPKAWTCTTAGGAVSTTRANETEYAAGVWATWTTGTTVWEVTTTGTTAAAPPDISAKGIGDTVTDGTAVWTMRSGTTAVFTSEGNL